MYTDIFQITLLNESGPFKTLNIKKKNPQYKLKWKKPHPSASGKKIHIDNGVISEHAHNPEYIWSRYDSLTLTLIFLETIVIFLSLICHKKNNLKTKDTLWNISIKEMHSNSSNTYLTFKKQ